MDPKGVDIAYKRTNNQKGTTRATLHQHHLLNPPPSPNSQPTDLGVVVRSSLGDTPLLVNLLGLVRDLLNDRGDGLEDLTGKGLLRSEGLLAGGLVEALDEGQEAGADTLHNPSDQHTQRENEQASRERVGKKGKDAWTDLLSVSLNSPLDDSVRKDVSVSQVLGNNASLGLILLGDVVIVAGRGRGGGEGLGGDVEMSAVEGALVEEESSLGGRLYNTKGREEG